MSQSFAERLRLWRVNHDLNRTEVAELLEVTPKTYMLWERDAHVPATWRSVLIHLVVIDLERAERKQAAGRREADLARSVLSSLLLEAAVDVPA